MVNVEIKTNVVDYTIKFTESITNNFVVVRAYPNQYLIEYAGIGNEEYYLHNECNRKATLETVIRAVGSTKKLNKEQKEPVVKVINRIIEEGNEYLKTIFNNGIVSIL